MIATNLCEDFLLKYYYPSTYFYLKNNYINVYIKHIIYSNKKHFNNLKHKIIFDIKYDNLNYCYFDQDDKKNNYYFCCCELSKVKTMNKNIYKMYKNWIILK